MAKILKFEDPEFPEQLKNIPSPPKKIYIEGNFLSSDKISIAIVGTRKPSHYGKEIARRLSYDLAKLGVTIISGLAVGVDSEAHLGALDAGGRTIAVLGSGLDIIYPGENEGLFKRITANCAAVSELDYGTAPANWTFPRRNRIISGLSLGTIVVEGDYKSGAMITAKFALDQGREVFAIPGCIDSQNSRGPHWLIKQGAKLVENIDDILEEIYGISQYELFKKEKKDENKNEIPMSDDELSLYSEFSCFPIHIDELLVKTKMEYSKTISVISTMEMKGIIEQLPGKMFVLKR